MGVIRTLRLLSWKYYSYRKFYWIWTTIEFLLPIIILCVTVATSDRIIGRSNQRELEYNIPPINIREAMKNVKYEIIHFTPNIDTTKRILRRARKIFEKIVRDEDGNLTVSFPLLEPSIDEPELVSKLSKANNLSIGFVNVGLQENERFTYKLRECKLWNTSSLFVKNETVYNGAYIRDPYYSSGFVGLQFCLDFAVLLVIHKINDHNWDFLNHYSFNISLKPFPYPAYDVYHRLRFLIPMVVGIAIIISSLILLIPLMFTLIHERSSGLSEMMNMNGLHTGLNWLSWFIHTFLFGFVVLSIITLLLKYDHNGHEYATIRFTEHTLLQAIISLYFTAQIAFCFVFCVIFNSEILGMFSFTVISLSMAYGAIKVHDYENFILVHLSCLCPVGAIIQAFERLTHYELLEMPVTWKCLVSAELNANKVSLGFVMLMFLVDTIIYLFLTWYINALHPGKYGIKKSPLFFILGESKKAAPAKLRNEDDSEDNVGDRFVQSVKINSEVGLSLRGLKKKYGAVEAVKGVNMTILKDEIFVILGSSKSGKTTIVSMITGATSTTEGRILYRGSVDLLRNFQEYKSILGYCPQEDRLIPYFTIIDHMMFYGLLKGGKKDFIEEQASQYLEWMELYENADDLASVLSKEMKRKLGIAIGLMGNSEILVIDEPTTGLEPTAKRRIWGLLSELKTERTIIITSVSAQEAGVLGDRVAILNSGVVVCEGSVDFLNETFATGYELKIRKRDEKFIPSSSERDPTQAIINLVKTKIPNAKPIITPQAELLFTLPNDTTQFAATFKSLETKERPLNIGRIEVYSSTFEKIFTKIGGESIYNAEGKPLKLDSLVEEAFQTNIREEEKLTGVPLIMEQHKALFMKKNTFVYRTWYIFLYRAFIPTVLMAILLYGTVKFEVAEPALLLSLKTYQMDAIEFHNETYSNKIFTDAFHKFLSAMKIGCKTFNGSLSNYSSEEVFLKMATENLLEYRKRTVVAFKFKSYDPMITTPDNTSVVIEYNRFARHSLPIGINILTNSILATLNQTKYAWIETYNHPVRKFDGSKQEYKVSIDLSESSPVMTVWYLVIVFFTVDLLDFISSPTVVERFDGFKQVQFLSSVSPVTYWINTFMFDFFFFFGIVALRVLVFQFLDIYSFFSIFSDFLVVELLIVLFIASGLLFMYLCSFILTTRYGAYALFTVFNIFCSVSTLLFYNYQEILYKNDSNVYEVVLLNIAKYIIMIIPPLNFNLAVEKFLTTWRINHLHEAVLKIESKKKKGHRRARGNYTRYLEFASESNPNGISEEVLFLVFDILFYALIILNVEYGFIYRLLNKIFSSSGIGKGRRREENVPLDVMQERDSVNVAVKLKKNDTPFYLIAQNLRKVYHALFAIFSHQKVAVSNASFVVKSGECFGIVGPQDSGKTVTFKMLAGEVFPTRGDSWILGTNLRTNKTEYYSKVGYCAQRDSFLEVLTGREILSLVASLRGIRPRHRQDTIERWMTILGLKSVIAKQCNSYDDGNKRKICAALALIGEPEVVLLDEPTTRIDPVSRRSMYKAFSQIKTEGRAAVVSFHSMQECGTICDRFTLMIKGQMKFIGTADEMTNKFGIGFTLLVVVKDPEETDSADSVVDDILQLKFAILDKFKNRKLVLLAESRGSVVYDVREKMKWSDVFIRMEALKKSLKFIDNYQVSDKSMDEIFTALVKGKLE